MYFELVEISSSIPAGNHMAYSTIHIVYADYGVTYGDVVQTLIQSLDSLENDAGTGPTSMKYQAALADQVFAHLEIHCRFC